MWSATEATGIGLMDLPPVPLGRAFPSQLGHSTGKLMTYSYTQISQYLACPRRYRHRYIDGWKEKDTRAVMFFGRAFELALSALFRKEDPGDVLFREWSACKERDLQFSNHDSWDRMLEQGIMLLTRFCQDDRVWVRRPRRNLQRKFMRSIGKNEFVAYIDAIGTLDGKRCLLEWKTSSARYAEEPEGLLSLDPQLVCYSWITGIADVAQVVFVRKRMVEIQYLQTTITDAQREEFSRLVEDTIRRIESAEFLPHSGIRFPQNPCSNCPYVGLCLGKQEMVDISLVRRPGAQDLGWLDELNY
jgi:CRISPR/Cas system-associated exonuclease Cas4 (RecB family)